MRIENDRLKSLARKSLTSAKAACQDAAYSEDTNDGTARTKQGRETRDAPIHSRQRRQQHQHGCSIAPHRSAQHQTRRCRRRRTEEPRIPNGARPDGVAAHLLTLMQRGLSCDGFSRPTRTAEGAHRLGVRQPTPCRRHRLLRRVSWRGRGIATNRCLRRLQSWPNWRKIELGRDAS